MSPKERWRYYYRQHRLAARNLPLAADRAPQWGALEWLEETTPPTSGPGRYARGRLSVISARGATDVPRAFAPCNRHGKYGWGEDFSVV